MQLFSIGILGEYVGRIYEEVKNRPLYTLAEIAGFEAADHFAQARSTTSDLIRPLS